MSVEDFSRLACPNPDCPAHGQRGGSNLRPHGWSTQDVSSVFKQGHNCAVARARARCKDRGPGRALS